LRKQVSLWRQQGLTTGLVPTMGALHAGHLSLVDLAKEHADKTIVSIFINPRQFAPLEDLATYPVQERADLEALEKVSADLAFIPEVREMYPEGFATTVSVNGVSEDLCGTSRPHFFSGVATVVTKLLLQCLPDIAIFGEKDYQQLLVIRQLVRDLNIPVAIKSAPIIREKDGLAMSSRNAYLGPQQRKIAPLLHAILQKIAASKDIDKAICAAKKDLARAGFEIDYLEVRDGLDLGYPPKSSPRIFAAAYLGTTRLIDNEPVVV
jgi:pantoate--beta-alanine ligase